MCSTKKCKFRLDIIDHIRVSFLSQKLQHALLARKNSYRAGRDIFFRLQTPVWKIDFQHFLATLKKIYQFSRAKFTKSAFLKRQHKRSKKLKKKKICFLGPNLTTFPSYLLNKRFYFKCVDNSIGHRENVEIIDIELRHCSFHFFSFYW